MSITIFKGLPGSGKSRKLIQEVNDAHSSQRPAVTILSSDAAWMMGYSSYYSTRKLASREPGGPNCPIDYFVSTLELQEVLTGVEPGTLVAVEEAQMFGADATRSWLSAAERGIDLILVSPSSEQLETLTSTQYSVVHFPMLCQVCRSKEAVTVIVRQDDVTVSVCGHCFGEESRKARDRTLDLLLQELPHRGEKALYQPVELPECSNWRVSRPDSQARLQILVDVLRETEIIGDNAEHHTYLDIGCSTGFFCSGLQELGLYAKGVDAVANNIEIAKLLDSFVRRQRRPNRKFVTYAVADAYTYLCDSKDESFDVISAFSVIQWVMAQRSVEAAYECFDHIFAKTKRVCVIEMGYSSHDRYGELLPVLVDRDWVHQTVARGGFDQVRVVEAGSDGVMRDLFIGIRSRQVPVGASRKPRART